MLRKSRNLLLLLAFVLGLSGHAWASSTLTVSVGGGETLLSSGAWDSGKITMWLSDTNGNIYIETVAYGQFSTPASIASAFAAEFSNSYVSAGLCAHASGNSISFYLSGSATLEQPSVVNPSTSFSFNPSNSTPPPPAGPSVDVCSSEVVDDVYDVEEWNCLYGDATSLTAYSEVDNYDTSGTIAGVEVEEWVGVNNQGYQTNWSQAQAPSDASINYVFVPQTNVYYDLLSSYGECVDTTQSDDYSTCSWEGSQPGPSSEGDVTQVPPPTITSLSPTSGAVGTSVTITGTNFGTSLDTTTVTFNGAVVTSITNWSPTSMVVVVPAGATTGNVVVSVSGWTSNVVEFTVPGTTPVVTSVTPSSGNVGLAVTISGYGFGATEGQSTVTVNGVQAGVLSWSDSSITAVVPSNATTGPVVVTLGDGEPSNNNVTFTTNTSSCN